MPDQLSSGRRRKQEDDWNCGSKQEQTRESYILIEWTGKVLWSSLSLPAASYFSPKRTTDVLRYPRQSSCVCLSSEKSRRHRRVQYTVVRHVSRLQSCGLWAVGSCHGGLLFPSLATSLFPSPRRHGGLCSDFSIACDRLCYATPHIAHSVF